jgi:hypothetical protein
MPKHRKLEKNISTNTTTRKPSTLITCGQGGFRVGGEE